MLPQQSGQRMSHCHNAAAASTDVILGGPVLSWPGRQCDAPKTHLVVSARQNSAPSGCRSKSQLRPCLPFFFWVKCSVCKSAPDSSTWQIFNQPGEWRVKKHCHSKDLCTSNPALSTATRYPLSRTVTRYSVPPSTSRIHSRSLASRTRPFNYCLGIILTARQTLANVSTCFGISVSASVPASAWRHPQSIGPSHCHPKVKWRKLITATVPQLCPLRLQIPYEFSRDSRVASPLSPLSPLRALSLSYSCPMIYLCGFMFL